MCADPADTLQVHTPIRVAGVDSGSNRHGLVLRVPSCSRRRRTGQ
jgi:hypothetical protein